MAIDLKGAWLCCKHAIPEMLSSGGGVIINIASVHATMTTYKTFPYAVAKAGLIGMTKSLAPDYCRERRQPRYGGLHVYQSGGDWSR